MDFETKWAFTDELICGRVDDTIMYILSRLEVVELEVSIPELWFYRVAQLGAYGSPRLVPRNCRPFDSRWERLVVVVLHYRHDFGVTQNRFVCVCVKPQPKEVIKMNIG